jgi:uncharacterized Zn-binding protein involved in type VI secretion
VRQLVEGDFLPAARHNGRLYCPAHQVQVIANARGGRKISGKLGRDA